MRNPVVIFAIWFIAASAALGHSGRTDSSGGHHDRKNGGYHYHGGGGSSGSSRASSPPAVTFTPLPVEPPKPLYRAAVRTEARTEARTSYTAEPIVEEPIIEEPNFLFHMTKGEPRTAKDFRDNREYWRVTRPSSTEANFLKRMVIRIEPTKDPRERRTWIDASGKFTLVAKFSRRVGDRVVLTNLDGAEIEVDVGKLSAVDQTHLKKIASSRS